MAITIKCPCCERRHKVTHYAEENWHGDQAPRKGAKGAKGAKGEVFAFAWCPDIGCAVGAWIAETDC
jgi:hypothetical protein